ncbi:MAG: ATP-binding protein [Desulfobulbaceae bacterium]
MAPSTALLFVLYGTVVVVFSLVPENARVDRLGMLISLGAALLSLTLFILSAREIYLEIERLGFSGGRTPGGVPLGHMSPLTAFCFLLAGTVCLARFVSSRFGRWLASAACGLAFVLVLISFVLLLAYATGLPFFYDSGTIPPALSTSLAFMTLGIALLVSSARLLRRPAQGGDVVPSWASSVFFMIFAVMATGIITAGFLYSRHFAKNHRIAVEGQLSAIVDLKVAELYHWRYERLQDAQMFYGNHNFSSLVSRYLDDPENSSLRSRLQSWLHKIQSLQYSRVGLYDADGRLRISSPVTSEDADGISSPGLFNAIRSGQLVFEDLYRNKQDQRIYLNILIPIPLAGEQGSRVIGVLALHIDPSQFLYPLINFWPTASETAETLLVRKDGDAVLFLNELRFRKDSALNLRIPLTREEVPAVRAVLGQTGIIEGRDYREVPVVAALRPVPDSPWFLVARMDLAEADAAVKERRWLVTLLVGALLIGAASGLGLLWRQQHIVFYRERCEVVETLRQSEETYRTLAENIPQRIFTKDRNSVYVSCNENFARDMGLAPAELVGKTDYDLFPREMADKFRADDRRIIASGNAEGIEESYVLKGEEKRWALTVKTPLRDKNGNIVGILGVYSDITERKQAEETIVALNSRLQHLISAIQELASARTLESVRRIVATSARRLTGADGATMVFREGDSCYYAEEDAIGPLWKGKRFPLTECISGWVMLNRTPAIIEDIYADERIPADAYRPTFVRSLAMVPVNTTEPVAAIGNYWSQRYHPTAIEIQLLQTLADAAARAVENVRLLDELEERVRARTMQFEAANKELEAFSYSVSHDLRAPLRAVDGFTRMLLEEFAPRLDGEGKRICAIISESARAMGKLIDDLLAFSRAGRSALRSSAIDMTTLAQAVFKEAATPEDRGRIDFQVTPLPPAVGDPSLIHQVWLNLLANALKFTAKKQLAVIRVGAEHQGHEIVYFVRDNGAGFDMRYADKLFGVFQRLHSTKEFEGTGVGLAIVQRIIKRHGGRIWAEGEPGKGATFYFTLSEGG